MKPFFGKYIYLCPKKGFSILFLLFLGLSVSAGEKYISYSPKVVACYENIISLKINEANIQLAELRKTEADNLAILHLENYIDFFILFISENSAEFDVRKENKNTRLAYLEKYPVKSPYYQFIKAEILLQWALVRLKFDEKLTAGSEVYQAYKLLESNKEDYPTFLENNKSLSIIHALAQSLPGWVRKIIGVKGSISLGTKEINQLADYALKDNQYLFREEVAAIYSYILFYQNNKKEEAIAALDKFNLDHLTNPLVAFLKASMYQRSGQNDKCLSVLNSKPSSDKYYPFYYLDFMLGKAKLYKLENDAGVYIQKFIKNFKGKHYIKEAYQKLAWYHLAIENDRTAYEINMANCISKGENLLDEDKQAYNEAKKMSTPNRVLLKARLLSDGGYNKEAEKLLLSNYSDKNTDKDYQIEYNYRLGRIYQANNNREKAKTLLNLAYTTGKNTSSYYACSAALQLGIMSEEDHAYSEAKKNYNYCLDLDPNEYKSSLHQKAKSGLERLKNK